MKVLQIAYWAAGIGQMALWLSMRIWAKNSRVHLNKTASLPPPPCASCWTTGMEAQGGQETAKSVSPLLKPVLSSAPQPRLIQSG
jgi:hypothetical protein